MIRKSRRNENTQKYPDVESWLKAKGWSLNMLAAHIDGYGSTRVFAGEVLEDEVECYGTPEERVDDLEHQIFELFTDADWVEEETGHWMEAYRLEDDFDESKKRRNESVEEMMDVKDAIDLYKKHGMLFLDEEDGKEAYEVLYNNDYTMKKMRDGKVGYCIELERMKESKKRRNEEHSDFDFEWEDYLSGEMGDFMRHLAKAFNQADLKNLAKLEKSFPEVYKVFAEFKGDVLHKFESKTKSENHIDYATFEDVEKGEISEGEYLDSFEYIYSSLINGNISQYKKQLRRLLQEGRLKDYQRYLYEFGLDGKIARFLEARSRRNEISDELLQDAVDKSYQNLGDYFRTPNSQESDSIDYDKEQKRLRRFQDKQIQRAFDRYANKVETRSRRNEEDWKNSPTAKEFSDFVEVLVDKMNLPEDEVFVNMDEMPMEVNFHKDDKKVRIEFSSEHVGAEKHLAVYVEDSEVDNFEYKPSSKEEIEKAVERVMKFIDKEVK